MVNRKPNIEEILEKEGIKLRQGWGLCPFHTDKNPSFKVNKDTQTFHCFGCGVHGDVIGFIQRYHHLSFKDALKYLGIKRGKPPRVNPKEKRKRELLIDFEQWRRDRYNELCDTYNTNWHVLRACKTMEEIEQHAAMIHEMSMIQYHIEVLSGGDDEAIYGLYRESI